MANDQFELSNTQACIPAHQPCGSEIITLGLNLMGHDISYSVLARNGTPILIAEEERYSRCKKGTFVPSPRQVYEVLEEAGVSSESVKHIAIANIPELIENRTSEVRSSNSVPIRFGQSKCFNSLFRALSARFRDLESVIWVRHHLCHAASTFFPSPFESAAVVTVDGMGEDETATIWHGEGTQLRKLFSIHHPNSLGYIYQAVSQWAGMTGAEREGKLMGLASLGEPRFLQKFREHFLCSNRDLGFVVAPALKSRACDNQSWIDYCETHFGPRRRPDEELTQYHMDVAASVQALVEEALQNLLHIAYRLTEARYCCMAGGVFMNSAANGRLRCEGIFEDLWVQPMASDNGLSLGAALWSYIGRNPNRERWRMVTPFLGSEVTEAEILSLIERNSINARRSNCVEVETAKLLAAGKLVGWVQGRSEVGARALGHRSVFADPRYPASKDKLNERIKLREPWRPFAPIVLEEDAAEFFADPRPSPFMMFVTQALPEAEIPAALHVDRTARVQTINAGFDLRLYKLLRAFKELTGIGVLVNTSFNVKGEPIVRTAEDAYRDFIGSGMDALIIGDYILDKPASAKLTGLPVTPPSRRVQVPEQVHGLSCSHKRHAIVSLGSPEFLEAVRDSFHNTFDLLMPPPPGKLGFRELLTFNNEVFAISDLTSYDSILVLLPIWVEVAVELIPNLLTPFFELIQREPDLNLLFADEAGGIRSPQDFLAELGQGGLIAPASEIEHFWFFRRGENKYGSCNTELASQPDVIALHDR